MSGARRNTNTTRKARPTRRRARRSRAPAVFVAVTVLALGAAGFWLWPRHLPAPSLTPPRTAVRPARVAAAPQKARAVEGAVPAAPAAAVRRGAAPAPAKRLGPRVAIVIDDLGDSLEIGKKVVALEPAVTVAVIPFRSASAAVAAAAVAGGREVILHLPLEPERAAEMDGARGFLRTAMEPAHMEDQLERDLRAVPYIVGVNGHMGSRFTSDPRAMRTLLGALRERGLFFLDSKTSAESVAAEIAATLQVPFAERNVFLDHDPTPAAVTKALALAVRVAREAGHAIAIGHPHAVTLAALANWLPEAARQGIEVVPLSTLVR